MIDDNRRLIQKELKYKQLRELLRQEINRGELKPGDKIPPEDEIADRYGVSLGTVRQAEAELANEGLIVRKQGKGTFIAEKKKPMNYSPKVQLTHFFTMTMS